MCFGKKFNQVYADLTHSHTPAAHFEESTFLQREAHTLDDQSYQTMLTKPTIKKCGGTMKF